MWFTKIKERVRALPQEYSLRYRAGTDPRVDWKISVRLFLIVTVLIIYFGVARYANLETGIAINRGDSLDIPKLKLIDKNSLLAIINRFEDQRTQLETLLHSRPVGTDPSKH